MGGKASDFLIPAAIGSIALAPMLFPALAGGAGGVIPASLAGGAFGAGAAGPPAAALAGSGFGGLMGAMQSPLFKMGSSMLMNQMGGGQQPAQAFPLPMPPPMTPQPLPAPSGGLADAASAIPQVGQPGMGTYGGGGGMPPGLMPGFGPLPIPPWGRTSIA